MHTTWGGYWSVSRETLCHHPSWNIICICFFKTVPQPLASSSSSYPVHSFRIYRSNCVYMNLIFTPLYQCLDLSIDSILSLHTCECHTSIRFFLVHSLVFYTICLLSKGNYLFREHIPTILTLITFICIFFYVTICIFFVIKTLSVDSSYLYPATSVRL